MGDYSSQPGPEFDVYFSFSTQDPQKHITEFTNKSLVIDGIRTFRDENQVLQRGLQLEQQRKEAIQTSRIAILLLSQEYLSSEFCLEELVLILRCRERWGMIVVPIFYDLNPSDLRKARGPVATALSRQRVGGCWWKRWKLALQEASDLCGWDHTTYIDIFKSESKFVGDITQDIRDKRIPSNLKISIYPIRYDTCYEYLNLFLQMGSNEVLVVGIAGQNKMGKTIIAKSVYDGIFEAFDGRSFLRGVGQKSRKPNGLVHLQEKLLSDLLLGEKINITSVTRGVDVLQKRLSCKKVLIVLDDIDNLDQLYALVGSRKWFGTGSKIIITTRLLSLLHFYKVDQVFVARGLPLPVDIQEIWEPYQQSCHRIAGLKAYIQSLCYMTNDRVKMLEDQLRRGCNTNAIQAQKICELKLAEEAEIG
ncbi:hypothetical protein CsatA_025738 [Cannabis sativa]